MATFTTTTDRFPYNTTVTVYPQSNWPTAGLPPSGAPVGSSTTSAVVSSASVLTFTGLTAGTAYFMTAEVGGSYRYVGFRTQATSGQVLTENGREEQSALVIPKYDRDNGQAGIYAPAMELPVGQTTLALTANRAFFGRFSPSRETVVTKLAFVLITAAGADDAVDVGIYSSDLTRLGSAGATTGKLTGSAGVRTVDLSAPLTLTAGTVYYAAFSSGTQGGSAGAVLGVSHGHGNAPDLFGATAGLRETAYMNTAHALPSSASFTSAGNCPILAVRES